MILETLSSLDLTALDSALLAAPQQGVTADQPTFLGILLRSIFVENILLAFFLGMCSYLAVSSRVDIGSGFRNGFDEW